MTKGERVTYKELYQSIDDLRQHMNDRFDRLEVSYVNWDEFKPVQRIVYGFVSLILVSVAGAILGLVIIK